MTSRGLCRAEQLLASSASRGPVLGIETGTPHLRLGLVRDGRVTGRSFVSGASHAAALPASIEAILASAGLKVRELEAIAIGLGPGSFTGLRIGASYARGLGMALGCPVVGVSTLDAMATAALRTPGLGNGRILSPLVDARRGEFYAALYRVAADELEKITDDLAVTLSELAQHLKTVMVLADQPAIGRAADSLRAEGVEVITLDSEKLDWCGACVAAIGAARLGRGGFDRSAVVEPLYLRPPGAGLRHKSPGTARIGGEILWSAEKRNSYSST